MPKTLKPSRIRRFVRTIFSPKHLREDASLVSDRISDDIVHVVNGRPPDVLAVEDRAPLIQRLRLEDGVEFGDDLRAVLCAAGDIGEAFVLQQVLLADGAEQIWPRM